MGSYKPLKQSFSPSELEAMNAAYEAAWAKLEPSVREPARAEALKDFLRRRIVRLAGCGLTDEKMLRDLTLDMVPPLSFGLQRPTRSRRPRVRSRV